MAKKTDTEGEEEDTRRQRFTQLRDAYKATAEHDKMLPFFMAGAFFGIVALFVLLGLLLPLGLVFWTVLGVVLARSAFSACARPARDERRLRQIEGQAGAAAAVLNSMRGDWQVTPAVAYNVSQDMVHRVVGKPGIILVAEGSPTRTKALILQEKKRVSRVAAEVPVYEITVGDDEGQIPLKKLQNHILRLPKNLDGPQMSATKQRRAPSAPASRPSPRARCPRAARSPAERCADRLIRLRVCGPLTTRSVRVSRVASCVTCRVRTSATSTSHSPGSIAPMTASAPIEATCGA